MYREAGRPIPPLHDDPVIDYMIIEAIAIKIRKEDKAAEKQQTRRNWQHERSDALEQMR